MERVQERDEALVLARQEALEQVSGRHRDAQIREDRQRLIEKIHDILNRFDVLIELLNDWTCRRVQIIGQRAQVNARVEADRRHLAIVQAVERAHVGLDAAQGPLDAQIQRERQCVGDVERISPG